MYLVKFLSTYGGVSRRKSAELIKSGAVQVAGQVETNPARLIDGEEVILAGKKVTAQAITHVYVALNKPRGYVCTHDDPHAPLKAVDLINLPGHRLFAAGRLDKESEGLLIFSDDGDFINHLSHPRYEVVKRYEVKINRDLPPEAEKEILAGIEDDGETLRALAVKKLGAKRYEFRLNEGKKREIRRLIAHYHCRTLQLSRRAMGPVELGALPSGQFRALSEAEVAGLLATAKR